MKQIKMLKIRINGIANIIRDQFENSSPTTVLFNSMYLYYIVHQHAITNQLIFKNLQSN